MKNLQSPRHWPKENPGTGPCPRGGESHHEDAQARVPVQAQAQALVLILSLPVERNEDVGIEVRALLPVIPIKVKNEQSG